MSNSNNKCDLIFVIPFFNEEKGILDLLESIFLASKNKFKIHLILVNHNSNDNTIAQINKKSHLFYKVEIINEKSPIQCGGIPRNTGFKRAISIAKNQYNNKYIPIATVDADVIISSIFVEEIISKTKQGFDIVSFLERSNSEKLNNFIKKQKYSDECLKSMVGVAWVRYQMLCLMATLNIKETRGAGGYAIKANILSKLKHLQPLDESGNPVTGENNRLGILANRKKYSVYVSPYLSNVNPRRDLQSTLNSSSKGYKYNSKRSETFKIVREDHKQQNLSKEQISNYLKKGIDRAIRMLLIRAVAFDKSDEIKNIIDISQWTNLIISTEKYLLNNKTTLQTLEIVGDGYYTHLFVNAKNEIGKESYNEIIKFIINKIPKKKELLNWMQNKDLTIPIDTLFINKN